MRSEDALAALGQASRRLAKTYAEITEALVGEGVPEEVARFEARSIVTDILWSALLEQGGEGAEAWRE